MTKSTSEYIKYVRAIVTTYLKGKSHLIQFRDDMEQEGLLALFKAEVEYNPSKSSMDKDLYLHYMVKQRLIDWVRSETKHFRKPESEDTQYWDLESGGDPDTLRHPQLPVDRNRLSDFLDRIELSESERVTVNMYLEYGEYSVVGRLLGTSRQNVRQVVDRVIQRCRLLN